MPLEDHYGKVEIRTLKPMRVACYRAASKTPEEDAHAFLRKWVTEHRAKGARPPRFFGFDVGVSEEQRSAGLRGYEVWATVPATVKPSEGVLIRKFPGGLYAVLRITDPFTDPFEVIPRGLAPARAVGGGERPVRARPLPGAGGERRDEGTLLRVPGPLPAGHGSDREGAGEIGARRVTPRPGLEAVPAAYAFLASGPLRVRFP